MAAYMVLSAMQYLMVVIHPDLCINFSSLPDISSMLTNSQETMVLSKFLAHRSLRFAARVHLLYSVIVTGVSVTISPVKLSCRQGRRKTWVL